MNNSDRKNETQVIQLVASVINNTAPPEFENADWNDIIRFAKAQNVLNIIAYAVERMKNKPDAHTVKFLNEIRMQKMVVEAEQEIEACDAMDKLEKMGIRHMPLKGFIIKHLYPSPDMRTMGDIDILVDKSNLEKIIDAFRDDGFTLSAEGDLHSNVERGNAYFEFHHSMVNKKYEHLAEYYKDTFSKAKKTDGYNYRYELSCEDMYIFLVAHVAKHYRYGGTGIRTVLDLYVYRKAYPNLDKKYIDAELKSIGLDIFKQKIEVLADNWFSGNFNGEYDSISAYIVSGGVYGNPNSATINDIIYDIKDSSLKEEQNKRRRDMIFPAKEIMVIRYPILKKMIFLLPLFWVIRFFDTLIHKPKILHDRLECSDISHVELDNDLIKAHRDAGLDNM